MISSTCRITDGSVTWTQADSGVTNPIVREVAVDPVTPTTVYATTGSGVFKTVNGAASWSSANSGLTITSTDALAIDPMDPTVLYVGTTINGRVFKSTNAATTWTFASFGVVAGEVRALIVDPLNANVVYAATDSGVFKTIDGAASWSEANATLTDTRVTGLAIPPATADTVYAATLGGLYKSMNGAASWTRILAFPTNAVAIDPTDVNTIYAAGNGEANTLYGSTYGGPGVLKSIDGGATWSYLRNGLSSTIVRALAIDPASPDVVYAGTDGGGVFDRQQGVASPTPTTTPSGTPTVTATPTPVCAATPVAGCFVAAQAQLQSNEKSPGQERLKIQWKKVADATTQGDFGDPVNGATRLAICLYDDDDAIIRGFVVDRAGQMCAGKPCWQAVSTKGYTYRDKLAASDGITKAMYLAGAAGAGQARAAGANNVAKGQMSLPIGVAAGLAGSTTPTLQVVTSDGLCIGATMTEVTHNDGVVYKARKK